MGGGGIRSSKLGGCSVAEAEAAPETIEADEAVEILLSLG